MTNNQNEERSWWDNNKKKVYIAGGIILGLGAVYYLSKNHRCFSTMHKFCCKKMVPAAQIERIPAAAINVTDIVHAEEVAEMLTVNVDSYIKTLPEGWHHSAKKAAEAAELGIELLENQTIVDSFSYLRPSA